MRKSVCIISTCAPYSGQSAREALDTVMVAASYEIPASLLLMGDGIFQLLSQQQPENIPRKNLSALFKALPLYDIDTIYIDQMSLEERGIQKEELLPSVTLLSKEELPAFIKQHDRILNF